MLTTEQTAFKAKFDAAISLYKHVESATNVEAEVLQARWAMGLSTAEQLATLGELAGHQHALIVARRGVIDLAVTCGATVDDAWLKVDTELNETLERVRERIELTRSALAVELEYAG